MSTLSPPVTAVKKEESHVSEPLAILARADVTRLLPNYDSHAEEWWARYGNLLLAHDLGCPVVLTEYHPWTWNLPGNHYTPDFLHILEDGRLVCVEVKGSKSQKNYRDARSKLRLAADLFRWLTWIEARVDGRGGCEIEVITL